MPEHLVVVFELIRIAWQDDVGGGGVETGTVMTSGLRGHINVLNPSQMSLEQGLETPVIADVILRGVPPQITIRESDQLRLIAPSYHPFINERWEVVGVTDPPMHPANRRGFRKFRVERIERTRGATQF
mgnify:CR=1 FL=1